MSVDILPYISKYTEQNIKMKIYALILWPIFVAPMSTQAAPPPGHPSTDNAATIMQLPDAEDLPYRGKVVQAINSNSYTYIQVQVMDKSLWLAAPRLELIEGQSIAFPSGTVMNNFFSRKLKRTFSSVLFVRAVEVLADQI